jgi:hypothetical protein
MTGSSTASKGKGKAPPSSPIGKSKSSKQRPAGHQQLSLSSFFKGPETIVSGPTLKIRKGERGASGRDQGIISIDDSSDDDVVRQSCLPTKLPSAAGPSELIPNGLLSTTCLSSPEVSSQEATVAKPSGSNHNIIEVDDSDSDLEAVTTPSNKKRKASSSPEPSGGVSTNKDIPSRRKPRLSTPPPSSRSTSAPGTPSKLLQLTAPLNPSPSKPRRTHDLFKGEESDQDNVAALPVISATAANITLPTFDFDTDPFLFRPDAVDTSHWPAGRLPYEVLVGVYLQVGGTRSRLAIVRIISKWVCLDVKPETMSAAERSCTSPASFGSSSAALLQIFCRQSTYYQII